jgi:hypothetical protein
MVRRVALVLASLAILFTIACAEPPTKEMNQAQGAIDAARAAGAETFAPTEYAAARAALANSHTAAQQRDYRQALALALDARERAQDAARSAADEKARARAEAGRVLTRAEVALERGRTSLAAARAARVPAATLAPHAARIGRAETAVAQARTAIERNDFPAATRAVDGLDAALSQATSEMDAAATARAARRPARRPAR